METKIAHNQRTRFDYRRFIYDVMEYASNLPPPRTGLTVLGRIHRETEIDKDVLKYAFTQDHIRSFDTILRLAGWAGLYLDEYRI